MIVLALIIPLITTFPSEDAPRKAESVSRAVLTHTLQNTNHITVGSSASYRFFEVYVVFHLCLSFSKFAAALKYPLYPLVTL